MGDVRRFTKRRRWSDAELDTLKEEYPTASWQTLERVFGAPRSSIRCKANALGLQRAKTPRMTDAERLAAKRKSMAERRLQDPETARAKQAAWRQKNRDRLNADLRRSVEKRLFWGRALRLRGISAFDLWKLWKAQGGRCALSGRKMDRTAEIDHKMPKVRGGSNRLENLQWVTREANRAKRDMTDAEFLQLCRDCIDWIAERMVEVEKW